MTVILGNQQIFDGSGWMAKNFETNPPTEVRQQQRKRKSEDSETSCCTRTSKPEIPVAKRSISGLLLKYGNELALLDSINVDLKESDCPYM